MPKRQLWITADLWTLFSKKKKGINHLKNSKDEWVLLKVDNPIKKQAIPVQSTGRTSH